ncbi:2Fe-2S iron-sulfur cluster-binding protein [Streptomyces sp. BI20]|uniref:2Fe-2S iron-sulfur cluster-binding protein n=1 Tax=Streptomyces sp. BI20 TaxID=3403460 RepID=UPI003C7260DE
MAAAPGRHGAFHPLTVTATDRLTEDSVALTLRVPEELREAYRHLPGQHLILRRPGADGVEVRRTYSICSPAPDPAGPGPELLRIGVRRVAGGAFSTFADKEVAVGDVLEAMVPAGRFTLDPAAVPAGGRYAAIVGGSGITPVLSIASTLSARHPGARFTLIRADRSAGSTMFLDEVADLKDRRPERFHLVTALSREEQEAGLPTGRLDEARLRELLPRLLPVDAIDGWYLCGPFGLVTAAERALAALGVDRARVHQEIFHVDSDPELDPAAEPASGALRVTADPADGPGSALPRRITARLDGRAGTWPAEPGESLLETVLRSRADAPYACKGGVCGTCRAFLVRGEVRMDRNFALEEDETDAGFVLACQSHPLTPEVEIDFDR